MISFAAKMESMNELTGNSGVLVDIRKIIEQGRRQIYAAANKGIVLTYWHIGRRIVEEEQQGEERAQYGKRLIKSLAEQMWSTRTLERNVSTQYYGRMMTS